VGLTWRRTGGARSCRRAERPMMAHTRGDSSGGPKAAGERCSFTRGTHNCFPLFYALGILSKDALIKF
jgi:hypothetical protein